jgi:hypothetical protein
VTALRLRAAGLGEECELAAERSRRVYRQFACDRTEALEIAVGGCYVEVEPQLMQLTTERVCWPWPRHRNQSHLQQTSGASRYYDPRYREAFALECTAIKRVRETMGLTNVKVMILFCRTLDEGRAVLTELAANGLRRGDHELEVYVMCEIPNNVVLATGVRGVPRVGRNRQHLGHARRTAARAAASCKYGPTVAGGRIMLSATARSVHEDMSC